MRLRCLDGSKGLSDSFGLIGGGPLPPPAPPLENNAIPSSLRANPKFVDLSLAQVSTTRTISTDCLYAAGRATVIIVIIIIVVDSLAVFTTEEFPTFHQLIAEKFICE